MESEHAIRCLVAAVQAVLSGKAEVVDGELRLPVETLDTNEGQAVSVDTEHAPGFIVYRLVPYPNEEGPDGTDR